MLFKNTTLSLFLLLTLNMNVWGQDEITPTNTDSIATIKYNYIIPNVADSVINYGKLFLNTPYRYGSSGSSSFDCSGFTSYVYKNFGVNLPRTSSDQAKHLPQVELKDLKNGDLVFFNGRTRNKRVGHVGIVVATKEDGEFDFIHASVHDGVIISNSKTDYYSKRFVKAGRVFVDDSTICQKVNTEVSNRKEFVSSLPTEQLKKRIPAKYHYVKPGETLSSIANKYDLSIAELKKNNNLRKDMLKPKQKLIVKKEEIIAISQPILAKNKVLKSDTLSLALQTKPKDVEPKSDVKFHKVKKGESLFSISKIYNIDESKLRSLNNLISNKILVGQELLLNENGNDSQTVIAANTVAKNQSQISTNSEAKETKSTTENSTHKILKGESLFSIAKLYNMTIDEIKNINNMLTNEIKAGQELLVYALPSTQQKSKFKKNLSIKTHKVESGETLSSIAAKYGCKINEIKNWNDKSSNKLSIGEKLIIKNPKT